MTYLALARKWRPRTFSELVGQTHVSQALINSLNQQRLHHAYLFTGTRGVGKTSIARLFAKSLNCEKGVSAEPCLECDPCQSITQGRFVDLVELDAASKTGVDDMRQLLDNTQYLPASARYKVFLIDEVHMLSASSFNALLKTLEEPPSHVKFILATTDPQKVPVTVLSRCLQFHLRPIPAEGIRSHLATVLEAENTSFEPAALALLAEAARGSLRDALSLLDQALALGGASLSESTVQSMLGYTRQDYALSLLQALSQRDAAQILEACRAVNAEGAHFNYVLQQIQRYLHEMMLVQQLGQSHPLLAAEPELQNLAQIFSPQDVQLLYQIALKAAPDIALAPAPLIGFEVAMLRMLAFWPATLQPWPSTPEAGSQAAPGKHAAQPQAKPNKPALQASVSAENEANPPLKTHEAPPPSDNPAMFENTDSIPASQAAENPVADTIEKAPPPVTAVTPSEAMNFDAIEDWARLIPELGLRGFALNAAQNAVWQGMEGNTMVFAVSPGHVSLFTDPVKERLATALGKHFNKKIKINIVTETSKTPTPAAQKQQDKAQALDAADATLQQDAVFNALKETFSATVVKNSIESLQDEL